MLRRPACPTASAAFSGGPGIEGEGPHGTVPHHCKKPAVRPSMQATSHIAIQPSTMQGITQADLSLLVGTYVNSRDAKGHTRLMVAAKEGSVSAVKVLLDAGADPTLCVQAATGHAAALELALIGTATMANKLALVELLATSETVKHGYVCLALFCNQHAPAADIEPILRLLIERGVDIDKKNNAGRTTLASVLESSDPCRMPKAELLVKYGASIFGKAALADNMFAPSVIEDALARIDVDFIDWVLRNANDFGAWRTQDMAVMNALRSRNIYLLGLVLSMKCIVNVRVLSDGTSWTPLLWACANGHELAVQMLLCNGASASVSIAGVTPLEAARRAGHGRIADMLQRQLNSGHAAGHPKRARDAESQTEQEAQTAVDGPPPAKKAEVVKLEVL